MRSSFLKPALTVAGLAVVCALSLSESAQSGYLWSPAEQVTDPMDYPGLGVYTKSTLEFSRGDNATLLHKIVRECLDESPAGVISNCNGEWGDGFYIAADSSLAWGSPESFLPDTILCGLYPLAGNDFRFVVDAADSVYVAFEVFNFDDPYPNCSGAYVGYKQRRAGWESTFPYVINAVGNSADTLGGLGGGASPRLALEERGAESDVLHLIYGGHRIVPDSSPADTAQFTLYTHKAVDEADDAWAEETYMLGPDQAGPGNFTVDGNGVLHNFGKVMRGNDQKLMHFYGSPPTTSFVLWTDIDSTVADEWQVATGGPPVTGDDAESVEEFETHIGGNYIYVTYSAPLNTIDPDADGCAYLRRFNWSTETWDSTTVRLSPQNGLKVRGTRLYQTSDDYFHVAWQEPPPSTQLSPPGVGDSTRIFHRYSTDPMNESAWSPITEIAPERTKEARGVGVVARADSVWTTYSLWDEDGSDRQMWFRTGHAIPDTVAADSTLELSGAVFLGADLVVEEGGTLIIADSTRVYADRSVDPPVQIVIRGTFDARGTASAPIEFTSWASDSGAPDAWGGLVFELAGSYSSYGYFLADEPLSQLEHVHIEDADVGVKISDHIAPSLADVTFDDIASGWEIYLDSCDVFVPSGWDSTGYGTVAGGPKGKWELAGPLDVVAADTVRTGGDAAYFNSGRVDMIFDASDFDLDGTGGAIDFGPQTENDFTGDNWGGLSLMESYNCNADGLSISHAANPLFVYHPDYTTISNTTIEYFAETGLWVHGAGEGIGLVFEDCVVQRGDNLGAAKGDLGILIDEADNVKVLGTTVDLNDLSVSTGGVGIRASFSKTFCGTEPTGARILRIAGCAIAGPENPPLGADYVGIEANWLCGLDDDRDIEILSNGIYDWKNVGVELYQSADVQVGCNHVVGCTRAVDVYRDSDPTGTSLRFKNNRLEALTQLSSLFAFRTNDAIKAKLGPSNALRGDNQLVVAVDSTKFIRENDADAADTLNATYNYWFVPAADNSDSLLTVEAGITDRLAGSAGSPAVDILPFYASDSSLAMVMCGVPGRPSSQEGRGLAAMQHGLAGDRLTAGGDVPLALSLGAPYPNPIRNGVRMELAVPVDRVGRYVLEIYDIAGRRVLRDEQEVAAAGRYQIDWAGKSGGGDRAAAGVYFLRMSGPGGFQETRKVTLLR